MLYIKFTSDKQLLKRYMKIFKSYITKKRINLTIGYIIAI